MQGPANNIVICLPFKRVVLCLDNSINDDLYIDVFRTTWPWFIYFFINTKHALLCPCFFLYHKENAFYPNQTNISLQRHIPHSNKIPLLPFRFFRACFTKEWIFRYYLINCLLFTDWPTEILSLISFFTKHNKKIFHLFNTYYFLFKKIVI